MSIILEGVDNSGKTTLAKELLQLNPRLRYFLAGSAPRDEEHEKHCFIQQFEQSALPEMIVDRVTCISQQVYTNKLFNVKYLKELDSLLDVGAIIVFCRPPTDTLMTFEKFTWRDEETEEHKQKILKNQHTYIERYDVLMQRTPHIDYDFTDEMSSAWLRKMLADAPFHHLTYNRLRDVMRQKVLDVFTK